MEISTLGFVALTYITQFSSLQCLSFFFLAILVLASSFMFPQSQQEECECTGTDSLCYDV